MKLRNKETGGIEYLRHGPATDAVTAGTHEFVNDDAAESVEKAPAPGGVASKSAVLKTGNSAT